MKDKIEHKFKELLENQELPYDSAAWNSMSKLLDQKMPVSKPTSLYRWLLGGAAITVIAVSTYFFINSSENTNQPNDITSEVKSRKDESKKNTVKKTKADLLEPESKGTNFNQKKEVELSPNSVGNDIDPIMTNYASVNDLLVKENQTEKNSTLEPNEVKNQNVQEAKDIKDKNENSQKTIETYSIICQNICLGEAQILENTNDYKVEIVNQNSGKVVSTIPAKSKVSFEAKENGNYVIKSSSNILGSFDVTSGIKPSLEVESTITYNKGIPTIKATALAETGLTWMVNNKVVNSSASDIEITPFKAGSYSISVSTNDNGCKVVNSQDVQISENYNLLAVNSFEPSSFEPKRQSFMPFALTQRDVEFTLIILDRRDGGIVYQTSDAAMPWNGVDTRSGQLVNSGQDFIWKVQLVNPLPGESSEYKGIITKL
jgi:hypothetical protein